MAERRFLHISFKWDNGDPKIAQLKPVFDRAPDWFRYTSNCWVVWTSLSAEKWYERLRPFLTDADTLFIVKLDVSERQGWLSKSMWDWLDKERKD
jgi:hypothetical protein